MPQEIFYAAYPGEMTDDDRARLDRPGLELFENGYGVAAAPQQLIRVAADSPEDARRRVVEALGREPEKLRIAGGGAA
jgi:hypothetical protein